MCCESSPCRVRLPFSIHLRLTRRRHPPTCFSSSPPARPSASRPRSKTPPSTNRRRSPPAMAPPPTCGPGSLPQLLFQAAADSDLHLFNRNASALGAGRGHLREAVEAVKSPGAGALHVSAGRGRMPVCAYLVEELLVDVNASDDSEDTPLAYAVRSGTLDTAVSS
ncbi:hypothetical protein PAHAL_1G234600 [Panicum hallii]|uniref:Uncharacterized protein n=1 Tax=Panicum hallii TaxID=206008 RepID=A0A2T8KW95_9POAL|nr:hypothetical protein PAHAL_1G234600 [Panicum hallii]